MASLFYVVRDVKLSSYYYTINERITYIVFNIKMYIRIKPRYKIECKPIEFINMLVTFLARWKFTCDCWWCSTGKSTYSIIRWFSKLSSLRERIFYLIKRSRYDSHSFCTWRSRRHPSTSADRPCGSTDVGHLDKNTRRALTETRSLLPRMAKREHDPYDPRARRLFARSAACSGSRSAKWISQTLERSRADFNSEGNAL